MKVLPTLSALAVVAAVAVTVAYRIEHRSSDEDASGSTVTTVAPVVTERLQRSSITRPLDAYGTVTAIPSDDHSISAAYECRVVDLPLANGAQVAKGERLLRIAPSPDAALLYQNDVGTLAIANKTLAGVKSRYALRLATKSELLAAQQADQDAARRVQSDRVRGLGGDGWLLAPVDGVVTQLNLTAGSLVAAGTPLCFVSDSKATEVRLGIEVGNLGDVHPGLSVELRSLTSPERSTTGVVSSVASVIDPVSGKADVHVKLPHDSPFVVGQHVHASINLETQTAFVVPRSAVLPGASGGIIFLDRAGKAMRCLVKIGISSGDRIAIASPELHEGDAVVIQGNYELSDGMAVQAASVASKEVAP